MPTPDRCRRWVEDLSIVQGRVVVTGWVFAWDARELVGMEIAAPSDGVFRLESFELFDSPDVAAAFPRASSAARCRFRVALAARGTALPDPFLAMLRPAFQDGVGRTWTLARNLSSPPDEFVAQVGGGKTIGVEFLDYFVDFGNLTPSDVVFDLGCGTGRMAIPLREYLAPQGRYIGLDVDPKLVRWCQDHIQARDRRFQFLHHAARNDLYNPAGPAAAKDMALPIASGSVSFAFATSVFTHLRAPDAVHLLRELGRILRTRGRLLVTAFVIDRDAEGASPPRSPDLEFRALDAETSTTDLSLPEKAIGFAAATLVRWAAEGGLKPVTRLRGMWAAGDEGYTFQDVLVFEKR